MGAGIESFNWAGRSDSDLFPVLSLRYGFTDNVEFYLLGIKYRIIHSDPFELVVKGRVTGYGYSSIDGTILQTEIGAEAKHRLHERFALLYSLEDYYTYFSDAPDRTDLRLSVGGLFSLTGKLALELKGTYRRLEKFNESEARVLSVAFLYNISPKFDIRLGAAFSDYSTSETIGILPKVTSRLMKSPHTGDFEPAARAASRGCRFISSLETHGLKASP